MSPKSTETESSSITHSIEGKTTHLPECTCDFCKAGWTSLVDRGCVVLDGSCDCPRTEGSSVPDTCKYLKNGV